MPNRVMCVALMSGLIAVCSSGCDGMYESDEVSGRDLDGGTATDSDTDADTDTDTDVDTDADADADCGFVDTPCCEDGTCASEELVCTDFPGLDDGDFACATECEVDMCGAEGFPELACLNVGWSDLGTCVGDPLSFQEEEALPAENACATGEFSGGSLCCPLLFGGDGAGWGSEKPEMCNGIDMSELELTSGEASEYLATGVGICLMGAGEALYCGLPCGFTNTCGENHSCYPLDGSYGACFRYAWSE